MLIVRWLLRVYRPLCIVTILVLVGWLLAPAVAEELAPAPEPSSAEAVVVSMKYDWKTIYPPE